MLSCALLAVSLQLTASLTVTVSGATGHTGSQLYLALARSEGVTVRGFIRNVTKAREVLGCNRCDESEGIYVGDVLKPATMVAAMEGADTLVITTGPAYHCDDPLLYVGCHFYPGATPQNMSWQAVKNQVATFAGSDGPALGDRHIVLLSNDMTTIPNNFLDKIDNAQGCFYSLNGEAFTMSSGLLFTILKPAGLNDGDIALKEIVVAHDDEGWSSSNPDYEFISRGDLVRLLTYAVTHREESVGLRFDVTSLAVFGTPTIDVAPVFKAAKYPWDQTR